MRIAAELSNIHQTGLGGVVPVPVLRPVIWTSLNGEQLVREFSEPLDQEEETQRIRKAVEPGSEFMEAVLEFAEALRQKIQTWNGEPARGIVLTRNSETAQAIQEGLDRADWAAIPEDFIPPALPADLVVWATDNRTMQLFEEVTQGMLDTFYKRPQNREMFLIYPADRKLNLQVEMYDNFAFLGDARGIMSHWPSLSNFPSTKNPIRYQDGSVSPFGLRYFGPEIMKRWVIRRPGRSD